MMSVYLAFASMCLFTLDVMLVVSNGVGAVVENDAGAGVRVVQMAALMVYFLVCPHLHIVVYKLSVLSISQPLSRRAISLVFTFCV